MNGLITTQVRDELVGLSMTLHDPRSETRLATTYVCCCSSCCCAGGGKGGGK